MKTPAVKGLFASAAAVALTASAPLLAVAEEAPKPYDAIVDYVESTGTQYVDTGIKIGSSHTVVLKFACSSDGYVFGSARGSYMLLHRDTLANGDELFILMHNKWAADRIRLVAAKAAGREHELKFGPQGYYLDGIRMPPRSNIAMSFSCTDNALLFSSSFGGGSPGSISRGRLWGCQIYNGETLVADFRPVRKGGNGYLFDRVTGMLLATKGGELTAGPDAAVQGFGELTFSKDVSAQNRRLKYIQSTGVQAMTTDAKSGPDTEMTLSFCFPEKPVGTGKVMLGFTSVIGAGGDYRTFQVNRIVNDGYTQERLKVINRDSGNQETCTPWTDVNSNDHVLVVKPGSYVLDGTVGSVEGSVTATCAGTDVLFGVAANWETATSPGGVYHTKSGNGDQIDGCPMRVYSYKMKKAGNLIRHLVPMQTAIGVGMWDKVENRFHPCISESADFIAGPSAPGLALFIH